MRITKAEWAALKAEAEYVQSMAKDDQFLGGLRLADMILELEDRKATR